MYIFLIELGEAFHCLRSCGECDKVSFVLFTPFKFL
jgi:hypothetical protein